MPIAPAHRWSPRSIRTRAGHAYAFPSCAGREFRPCRRVAAKWHRAAISQRRCPASNFGGNPALLASENPNNVARANLAFSKASRPALDLITRHEINWTIVASATPDWARDEVSERTGALRCGALWDAIFAVTRSMLPTPSQTGKRTAHIFRTSAVPDPKRLRRAPLPRAWNQPAPWFGRRPCLAGRRHNSGQRDFHAFRTCPPRKCSPLRTETG